TSAPSPYAPTTPHHPPTPTRNGRTRSASAHPATRTGQTTHPGNPHTRAVAASVSPSKTSSPTLSTRTRADGYPPSTMRYPCPETAHDPASDSPQNPPHLSPSFQPLNAFTACWVETIAGIGRSRISRNRE